MRTRPYTISKYVMWVIVLLIFLGFFIEAVVQRNGGAALFMGIAFVGLFGVGAAAIQHERIHRRA